MKGIVKPEDLLKVDDGKAGAGRVYNIKDVGQVYSVTSILEKGFPPGYGLLLWFKRNTEAECEAILDKARARGTRIHDTAQRLIETGTFNLDILNPLERVDMKGLIQWKKDMKPKFIEVECVIVYCEDGIRTAGRVDLICKIGKDRWIVDFKTGSRLHKNNEPQVALYAKAAGCNKAGLLHLNSTKRGYSFKEIDIEPSYKAFKNAYGLFNFLGCNKLEEKDND